MNISQLDEMTLRFVDRFGIDMNGNECLILEVSDRHASNNYQNACDDILKIVQSLMCILKGDAQANVNAGLASYQRMKAFGIQTVKTTIIFSEIYLGDDMKYKYKEAVVATIRIKDNEQMKWL
ncbi:hypothetical protein CLU79DRAFT_688520, partial [Phycomyces nitens]